jgi:LysM repeat protein
MDTISSETNGSGTSYVPIFALIVGGVAVVLAIVALVKLNGVSKRIDQLAGLGSRIETLQGEVRGAVENAERVNRSVTTLQTQTQRAVDQLASEIGTVRTTVNRIDLALKEAPKPAPAPAVAAAAPGAAAPAGTSAGPAPAGTYVVKPGDTGVRIAQAHNVTLAALMAANPEVDWNRLRVGQSIRIPGRS